MSDETVKHGDHNGGFEHEDLSAKPIFLSLLAIVVLGVLVYLTVTVTYGFLNHYQKTHQPPLSPLKQNIATDTREEKPDETSAKINRVFPEPRLETDERNEINSFREQEEERLNSYGWVEQPGGAVHIPIERAMQLVAQRGLPVRSQGEMKSGNGSKEHGK